MIHVPLLFSVVSFLCIACCVKQRNFGFDKSSELSMENVHNEKCYHVTLMHVVSLCEFIEKEQ